MSAFSLVVLNAACRFTFAAKWKTLRGGNLWQCSNTFNEVMTRQMQCAKTCSSSTFSIESHLNDILGCYFDNATNEKVVINRTELCRIL